MLELKDLCKEYKTGTLVQKALDHVSLNLRDNEFVAILGPSGSGKSTLLNIVGGLDHYDSGDLVINGISTKKYKDRDWDSYRNHTIGFIFQSYNLIPHQTVLANVELALTISGISRKERTQRAKEALEKVGLAEQMHKKPSQMSGGQMQRVAIARALVNNPDILLADEPTGALDTETSIQVMELLKEVAKDRLVVMVTHNPDLAYEYANRIVKLKDGKIISDTNPYTPEETEIEEPHHENMGKSSMSFLTALGLSFNNLMTKKARTILVSFAGSIGIIGIALILSLSNGVNTFIRNTEEDTLSEYPLEIEKSSFSFMSMMGGGDKSPSVAKTDDPGGAKEEDVIERMTSSVTENDLVSFKKWIDGGKSGIKPYARSIEYTYSVTPQIFRENNGSLIQVNPNKILNSSGLIPTSSLYSSAFSSSIFSQLPADEEIYKDSYEVKAGRWPENYDEAVVVLDSDGSISDMTLYTLGLKDYSKLEDLMKSISDSSNATVENIDAGNSSGAASENNTDVESNDNASGSTSDEENVGAGSDDGSTSDEENVDAADKNSATDESGKIYPYDDLTGAEFLLYPNSSLYSYDDSVGVWTDRSDDTDYIQAHADESEKIKVVGVVMPTADTDVSMLTPGIAYTSSLVTHIIDENKDSDIVRAQLKDKNTDVLTGKPFGTDESEFDPTQLFSIDSDAVQNAFNFDTSKIKVNPSSMDFSGLYGAVSESTVNALQNALSGITLESTGIDTQAMFTELMNDYLAKSTMDDGVTNYLNSDEAKAAAQQELAAIAANKGISGSDLSNTLTAMEQELIQGFTQSLIKSGAPIPTNTEELNTAFSNYLATDEAKQIISNYSDKITSEMTLTSDDEQALINALISGWTPYAAANGYTVSLAEDFQNYLAGGSAQEIIMKNIDGKIDTAAIEKQITSEVGNAVTPYFNKIMSQFMLSIANEIPKAFSFDESAFMNAFHMNMDADEMQKMLASMMSDSSSYENNLKAFGYANLDDPDEVIIYPKDFDSKTAIEKLLDKYNDKMKKNGDDGKVISYTDIVGTMMTSVTKIVNTISGVLIAFVAISLVVSSIMIGVITHISVLERRKEIGILRAIGASKHNIREVFNAETFITGLLAGGFGIGISLLLLIPTNMVIKYVSGRQEINAALPPTAAIALILLSVVLTLISGVIPAQKAAKSDPVAALRTE